MILPYRFTDGLPGPSDAWRVRPVQIAIAVRLHAQGRKPRLPGFPRRKIADAAWLGFQQV
jgi:hypothetical protein